VKGFSVMKIKSQLVSGLMLVGLSVVAVNCSSSPATGAGGNTGGGGGAGGTTGGGSCPTSATAKLSDFQMGTGIESVEGRMGGWYLYGDTAGTFTPPKVEGTPPPADTTMGSSCSPNGSFHVKGTGFSMWGAGVGTNFVMPTGTTKNVYDASKYSGVIFYAKASAPVAHVQVKFLDQNTDPDAVPQKCKLTMNGDIMNCSPYLVKFDESGVGSITTDWKQYKVAFADTAQDQYNTGYIPTPAAVDKAHLTSLQIQVNANFATTPATANDFDLWIDDVYFY
jgi:hypothetical protein